MLYYDFHFTNKENETKIDLRSFPKSKDYKTFMLKQMNQNIISPYK